MIACLRENIGVFFFRHVHKSHPGLGTQFRACCPSRVEARIVFAAKGGTVEQRESPPQPSCAFLTLLNTQQPLAGGFLPLPQFL